MQTSPVPAKIVRAYCHLLAKNPGVSFGVLLFLQSLPFVISLVLQLYNYDVFPTDFSDVPLILQEDPSYQNTVAWNLRNSDPNEPITQSYTMFEKFHQRNVPADITELYYATADGSSILTATNLLAILKFENRLLQAPDYKKFCVVRDNHCMPTRSLARMMEEYLMADSPSNAMIQKVLKSYYYDREMNGPLMDFLDLNANISKASIEAKSLRSYIYVAWVVDANSYDDIYTTKDYASDVLHPLLWSVAKQGHLPGESGISFFYYNSFLYFDYLRIQVIYDLLLAVGSFCFIFIFLWVQTRSFFIAFFGIYGIVTNFFTANLAYRYVLDFRYFGVFHILAIFIILGIGVDDIFVFTGAWNNTKSKYFSNLGDQLEDAYHRASATMFVTSVTTAVAFFVNGLSPLLAVKSFGIFSGLLVSFNYFSIITYFVGTLMFYESNVKDKTCKIVSELRSLALPGQNAENDVAGSDGLENEKKTISGLGKFLEHKYMQVLSNTCAQVAFIIACCIMLLIFTYSATRIDVDDEEVKLYRSTHFLGKAFDNRKRNFHTAYYDDTDSTQIYLIWGIKGLNRSYCHKTDWKSCAGSIVWNDEFDMNPYHAQKNLLKFCGNLRGQPEVKLKELKVKITNNMPEINCFIEEMNSYFQVRFDYFQRELNSVLSSSRSDQNGLPATDIKVRALMVGAPDLYARTVMLDNPWFYRYFETATMYWLHDGYWFMRGTKPSETNSSWSYIPLLGHSINSDDLQQTVINNVTVTYGTKLRYAAVVVNTTLGSDALDHRRGLKVMDAWIDFIKKMVKTMHPSLRHVIIATPSKTEAALGIWHWFKLQQTLLWSAVYGILLSLALAFPVLILSTDDIHVGSLATLMIAFTTISVVGIIPLAGWKLGVFVISDFHMQQEVLESLNLTLVVGLSVDYIVHVAEAYHLAQAVHREDKVLDAIRKVGSAVLSGALSTLGASFFMLFAKIVFFMQFGLFIFCTVGFAITYSLVLFVLLLYLIGPESNKFSISTNAKKFWRGNSSLSITENKSQISVELQTDIASSDTSRDIMFPPPEDSGLEETIHRTSKSIDDDNISSSGYDSGEVTKASQISNSIHKSKLISLNTVKPPPNFGNPVEPLQGINTDTESIDLSTAPDKRHSANKLRTMTPVESGEVVFYSSLRQSNATLQSVADVQHPESDSMNEYN